MIVVFERGTGRIIQTVLAPSSHAIHYQVWPSIDVLVLSDEAVVSDATHYVADDDVLEFPARPSPFHYFDWTSKTWSGNQAEAREARVSAVDAERARRAVLPISHGGAFFDADAVARERISGAIARCIRGDGLPAGWVGWRDADNAMHWGELDAAATLVELRGLSSAIEDREQALLIAAWTHKAAIGALPDDIDAILGYDLSAGWPAS